MEIAERLGDEVLWTGGAEAYAWHMLVGGGLAEGIDTIGRAFDVADRLQRSRPAEAERRASCGALQCPG